MDRAEYKGWITELGDATDQLHIISAVLEDTHHPKTAELLSAIASNVGQVEHELLEGLSGVNPQPPAAEGE